MDGFGTAGPSQIHALKARKHIAVLRRARPGIAVEIRWCPAVPGNEKADEWAKLAEEKPDTRRVEAHDAASQIPCTPWARDLQEEVGRGTTIVGGRTSRKKHRMPGKQKPETAVAGSST